MNDTGQLHSWLTPTDVAPAPEPEKPERHDDDDDDDDDVHMCARILSPLYTTGVRRSHNVFECNLVKCSFFVKNFNKSCLKEMSLLYGKIDI